MLRQLLKNRLFPKQYFFKGNRSVRSEAFYSAISRLSPAIPGRLLVHNRNGLHWKDCGRGTSKNKRGHDRNFFQVILTKSHHFKLTINLLKFWKKDTIQAAANSHQCLQNISAFSATVSPYTAYTGRTGSRAMPLRMWLSLASAWPRRTASCNRQTTIQQRGDNRLLFSFLCSLFLFFSFILFFFYINLFCSFFAFKIKVIYLFSNKIEYFNHWSI